MEQLLKDNIQKAISNHLDKAIALSEDLAEHPETSAKEYESSRKIAELLKDAGFEVTYPYAGYDTAFCGLLDNGDGPSVAVMVEYDALPGIGHACGHNLHGSLSVLTGLALMDLKDQFKGKLYVIGTPAEEEDGAKIGMAKAGIFDKMSLAVMMHSNPGGFSVADMDVLSLRCYEVEFFGQTAHAVAGPWNGKSALAAARKFLDLIDARRECFTPDIHVNAVFVDGGKAPNIIPDYAKIRMEFRTNSMTRLEVLDDTIKKCANGAAMALDCTAKFTFGLSDFADMVLVDVLEDESEKLLQMYGEKTEPIATPVGSSDVGNVSYRCPAIQPLIAITDDNMALHTTEFRDATRKPRAYHALEVGASCLTALSLKVFNDKEFCDAVHDSWQKALKKKQSI